MSCLDPVLPYPFVHVQHHCIWHCRSLFLDNQTEMMVKYGRYCINHTRASLILEQNIQFFFLFQITHGLQHRVDAMLIKPIQRLTRLGLIFKQIACFIIVLHHQRWYFQDFCRHGILHKLSASVKFWPKSFHKNSVIFVIFRITNYAWFWTVLAWQTVWFLSSHGMLDQLNTRFCCKPFQRYYSSIFTLHIAEYRLFTSTFAENF